MQQGRAIRSHVVVAAALAVAAVAGAVIASTPMTMNEGFEKALSTSRSELTFAAHHDNRPGDEGYWLTRAEVPSPALFVKPVAVGDRITISGNDGHDRKLEVVDVKAVGTSPKDGDAISLLLVTARIANETADKATVRFIVEGQMAKTPPQQAVSKAL